ncbi:hypothetical protein SESBI_08204 [Sesbania bispinosa]|nr:hypothetical protein SESBI_08204 [Sesbania bispinosa]
MSKRGSKPRFVFIVLPLLLSLMCQEIEATSRLRSKENCGIIACHVKITGLHQTLEMEDRQGNQSPPHDGYDYDYDFYRKHGDIPSPGAGH